MPGWETQQVYSAESALRHPGRLARGMLKDLGSSRELAWRLLVRDIQARYRQTFLGYAWAFLPPVALALPFVFLKTHGILATDTTTVSYGAWVLIGVVLWQTFVDALTSPLRMVRASRAILAKVNFPREALVLAATGQVLFDLSVRSSVLAAGYVLFEVSVPATAPLALVGVLCLIAMGLLFGILLTPLGVLYQDVERALAILTGFWMLLTPVVYPPIKEGTAALLSKWNPVSPVILATRDWLTTGTAPQATACVVAGFASVLLLLAAWLLYRLAMPYLLERMSN